MTEASRDDDRARILGDVRAARVMDPGLPELPGTAPSGADLYLPGG